jgi:tetratricopeptide (TPR) repeat protein
MPNKSLIYAVFVLLVAFLLNLYPVDIEGLKSVRLANQTLKDGQSLAALNQYKTILSHSPEKMFLYQNTGKAAFWAGEFEMAKYYLELADINHELDDTGLLILGDVYQINGNWKQAVNVWKKIDMNQRNVHDVSTRLLNIYISQVMWNDAESTLTTQLKYFPEESESREMLAWIELFIDLEKARMTFNDLSAGTVNPGSDVSSLIDKFAEIKDDAQQVGVWWIKVGDLAAKYNHPEISLKAFEKSTEINDKFGIGWMKIVLQKQNMSLDVGRELEFAEKYGENDSIVNALLAEFWYKEKKPELSIIYLHKALELDSNSRYSSLKLSQILSEIGNINEGLKYIKESALQLNTANSWMSVIIYCLENRIYIQDEALPAVRKAISLEPDSPEILDLAGQVFVALEDEITAERYFNQAVTKDKSFYLAQLHLGSLYVRIGSIEKARIHLTAAAQQSEDSSIRDEANQILTKIQTE